MARDKNGSKNLAAVSSRQITFSFDEFRGYIKARMATNGKYLTNKVLNAAVASQLGRKSPTTYVYEMIHLTLLNLGYQESPDKRKGAYYNPKFG